MKTVPGPIEFWFEFSSPYAYFAALDIDALARRHSKSIVWRPFLLGAVFRVTRMEPLPSQPMRGAYAIHDWERLARLHRVSFSLPSVFPIISLAPARMTYAMESMRPEMAGALARHLLTAMYQRGADIADASVAARLGAELGLDERMLVDVASDQRWKDALRARNDEAIERGIFGSPFFVVEGEAFWGSDRLAMVDRWLDSGGW
ncbi:2-hydroxychromene-2-carboxylate isomerase [Mesorhizobium qingshengii]|uniref:2-hydroxychromene-2-carboxylate isomerase n=1 Tax=Mesorhizobium qingshengii TaxID=1165689 RepID=A0A1G5Z9R3_9HYPH|nr:2-hydroxychromene-2-carboxylate isomerase [Mesorhizobium qingshengii]SDA91316.1 2-hydroxychromene-2-carboxylate isomerase [Mesorhizobium qingshengii]